MIKELMALSFFKVLDEELKYLAQQNDDYFIYNRWKTHGYIYLSSLDLWHLKKLDLSFLGLKVLPYEIGYFQNLEELNLSGNQLRELPNEIFTLKNLKVLNLGDIINGGNQLQCIPKDIEKLTYLEVLKIVWNNELKELPKEILNLKNLDFISLSQQAILETNVGKELEQKFCIDFEDF